MKDKQIEPQDFEGEPNFTITIDVFDNGIRSQTSTIKKYEYNIMQVLGALAYGQANIIKGQMTVNIDSQIYKRLDKLEECNEKD